MTPEPDMEAFLKQVSASKPADAIALAVTLALCSDLTLKLLPDQRRDILLAGFDAYKLASYVDLAVGLRMKIKGAEPSGDQVAARIRYAGVKSAQRAIDAVKRLFTLCEMVQP